MSNPIRNTYKRLGDLVRSGFFKRARKPAVTDEAETHIAALCKFPDHEDCLLNHEGNCTEDDRDVVEHIKELEKISTKNKYLNSFITGLHTICIILSNHAPIFATILLIVTLIGLTLSPPLALALGVGIVSVLVVTAIISFILKKQDIERMNNDIEQLKKLPPKLTSLREQVLELKAQNDVLKKSIGSANLDLSAIERDFIRNYCDLKTGTQQQEEEDVKKHRIMQVFKFLKNVFKNLYNHTSLGLFIEKRVNLFKDKFKQHAPWLFSKLSKTGGILICIIEGVAAIGGALALASIVMGVNVFQMSIVASFAAVTGLAGPVGIALAVFLAVGMAGILLANKILFDKPIVKQQDKINYCKNQQRVEFAKIEREIHKLQLENLYLENELSKHQNMVNSPVVSLKDAAERVDAAQSVYPGSYFKPQESPELRVI